MDRLGRALVILGVSGVGKSTIGRHCALRWPAKRYVDAGTIREVLRADLAELQLSTYDSWRLAGKSASADNLFQGFERYTALMWPAVVRVMENAALDRSTLVMDGAMLSPRLVANLHIVGLQIHARMLYLNDPVAHLERLKSSVLSGSPQKMRLVKNFSLSRLLQDYLMEECIRLGIPILENVSLEPTLNHILTSLPDDAC